MQFATQIPISHDFSRILKEASYPLAKQNCVFFLKYKHTSLVVKVRTNMVRVNVQLRVDVDVDLQRLPRRTHFEDHRFAAMGGKRQRQNRVASVTCNT